MTASVDLSWYVPLKSSAATATIVHGVLPWKRSQRSTLLVLTEIFVRVSGGAPVTDTERTGTTIVPVLQQRVGLVIGVHMMAARCNDVFFG